MRAVTRVAVFLMLVVSIATGCGSGHKQRTLHLLESSRNYTRSSATTSCTLTNAPQWKVATPAGEVLARGTVNTHGHIQTIQGMPTCATVTTARVRVEQSYLVSSCPTCGTTTVFDSNLDAQKDIVPLP